MVESSATPRPALTGSTMRWQPTGLSTHPPWSSNPMATGKCRRMRYFTPDRCTQERASAPCLLALHVRVPHAWQQGHPPQAPRLTTPRRPLLTLHARNLAAHPSLFAALPLCSPVPSAPQDALAALRGRPGQGEQGVCTWRIHQPRKAPAWTLDILMHPAPQGHPLRVSRRGSTRGSMHKSSARPALSRHSPDARRALRPTGRRTQECAPLPVQLT